MPVEMAAFFFGDYDEARMKTLAQGVGAELKAGDCLALHGDLGAGKSTFARALIRSLTGVIDVPSPTFTLAQYYTTKKGPLTHFDLYRLKKPAEVYDIGWEEALAGMVLVEWPEQIGTLLPESALAIHLDFAQHQLARTVTIKGSDAWATRLKSLIQKQQN
jgi:tRNA threonylcarbamoyladenosine biosynthesis protein TsaE